MLHRFEPLMYRETQDLTDVISPPYDVISLEQREELLKRHPNHSIHLILGNPLYLPQAVSNDKDRYKKIARTLETWIKKKILIQNKTPQVFVVRETFQWKGQRQSRLGVLSTVDLEPLGEKHIFGHENTLAKPIEDRLELLTQTQTQFCPILLLIFDEHQTVLNVLNQIVETPPKQTFKSAQKDVDYEVWSVTDPKMGETLEKFTQAQNLMIADGHHRYKTAFQYHHTVQTQKSGRVLSLVCPSKQPGIVLSSIQRFVQTKTTCKDLLETLKPLFEITPLLKDWKKFENSGADLALFDATENMFALKLKHNPKSLVPTEVLSFEILKKHLSIDELNPQDQKKMWYEKKLEDLDAHTQEKQGLAFWVRPMTMKEVFNLTKTKKILPPKSTYFYPKIETGIAFYSVKEW